MATKFKIRKRLNSTKLKLWQKTEWVAGNSSMLMQKVTEALDTGMTTGASVYSARTAAIDVAHAAEDYACSDYTCLALDSIAAGCDLAAIGLSFLPKTRKITYTFAGCTAASKFSRTLRNKCKESQNGIFVGCKD